MKELYTAPTLEITKFDEEDIITASPLKQGTDPGNPSGKGDIEIN